MVNGLHQHIKHVSLQKIIPTHGKSINISTKRIRVFRVGTFL